LRCIIPVKSWLSWRLLGRLVVTLLVFAVTAPAYGQIYSWRDANGNLVLSNRRPNDVSQVHSYAVPNSENVRATRHVTPAQGRQYDELISEHSKKNGVRVDLVRAVVQVESAFNPYARSPKGALGLMQLMPSTLRQYGVRNPFDPQDNVRAGVAYLRELLDRYQNNEQLALAAYNAGPGAVDKYGQSVPPYRETRQYVAHIKDMVGSSDSAAPRDNHIYKVTDVVDGQTLVRYTDKRPSQGSYEIIR
jgi:soluble lytic murein transglycosylase-like protein